SSDDTPSQPSEIFSRSAVTGPLELTTTNHGTRSNTRSIWLNSFDDLISPARIRSFAVSASEWRDFPKDIPPRQIDCSKWITLRLRMMLAPTTSSLSCL